VFAVEDHAVQVTWRAMGPGPVRVRCGDSQVEAVTDGGPGSVTLEDLPAGTRLDLLIDGEGAVHLPGRWRHGSFTTLTPPPGEELGRFATISDLHLGDISFGFRQTMVERPVPDEAHPVRAARAAIEALTRWGAETLVVKGDLTRNGRAKDWNAVGRLLDECKVPVRLVPGNHDYYGSRGEPEPFGAMGVLGHAMTRDLDTLDIPGLRLVLVNSVASGKRSGQLHDRRDALVGAIRDAAADGQPAFVALHHYAQRLPFPTFLPPGISSLDANPILADIAAAQPATMISSGHTHRHRRRHVGPLVLTEVGATKDFPGTWAGYVVHEGGIRQVVRRVDPPDVLRWTDFSAGAALGAWGMWSPGLLDHRCFTHVWPARATTPRP
jgi:predicted phosphodiesterase